MSPEISKSEVRKRLEEAVEGINITESFLDPRVDEFIQQYRIYSAQLRKNDSLKIIASPQIEETKNKDVPTIYFKIILIGANGGRKELCSYNSNLGWSRPNLLYDV